MLKPLVLGAEVARRVVSTASRVPGADVFIAKATVNLSRGVPSRSQAGLNGSRTRRQSLQDQVGTVLFAANPRGAHKLRDRLDISSIDDAATLERLAARYAKIRDFQTALALRRGAAELEPDQAHRHIALFWSLTKAGEEGIINDAVVGLAAGPQVMADQARAALRTADRLAPGSPYILHQFGRFEFTHGEPGEGLTLLRQAAAMRPTFKVWLDLASRLRQPHILQTDEAFEAYAKALEISPRSPQAMRGLVITGCRGAQDWPRIWANARRYESAKTRGLPARTELMAAVEPLFTGPVSDEAAGRALTALEDRLDQDVRLSWPTTALIVYRLQFTGHFTAGFRLRRRLAQRTLAWLGTTSAGNTRHRQKVLAALICLERYDEAQRLIDPPPWDGENRLEQLRLEKMAADMHLVRGDVGAYMRYSAQQRDEVPMPGDAHMQRLVEGRRVAIVGPADTGDRLGEVIDGYDVVLRPRYQPEAVSAQADRLGSRTDIAYFNGRDLSEAVDAASEGVRSGDLQLAVGRGLSLGTLKGEVPDWLRFYRYDFSLAHHGGLLGISRMAYDIIQFAPAEITVFNIDFYTGQNAFTQGYRVASDQVFGPHSVMNDIILAHDLLFDFRLLQSMMATGIVTAQGVAGDVLSLSEEDYLAALDASPALRTPTVR